MEKRVMYCLHFSHVPHVTRWEEVTDRPALLIFPSSQEAGDEKASDRRMERRNVPLSVSHAIMEVVMRRMRGGRVADLERDDGGVKKRLCKCNDSARKKRNGGEDAKHDE
jgi:hypothetical protein